MGMTFPQDGPGISIADTRRGIETHQQLGGLRNTPLAIPGHLNSRYGVPVWNSIEFVQVPPGEDCVGRHTQETDEMYVIVEGAGALTTNGDQASVMAGMLVIAPRGTTHSIQNTSHTSPLSFLAVELHVPPGSPECVPTTCHLLDMMEESDIWFRVSLGTRAIQPRVADIDLAPFFKSSWRHLSLVTMPPGAQREAFCEPDCDQLLLFIINSYAVVTLSTPAQETRIETEGTNYPEHPRASWCSWHDQQSCQRALSPALRSLTGLFFYSA